MCPCDFCLFIICVKQLSMKACMCVFLCLMPGVCSCCSCLTNCSQAELITHRWCTSVCVHVILKSFACTRSRAMSLMHRVQMQPYKTRQMHWVISSTPNQVCTVSSVKPHYGTFHISICWTSGEKQRVDIVYLITQQFFCLGPVGRAENHITRSWANNSLTFLLSAVRHKLNFVIRQQCLLISIFPRGAGAHQ